MSDDQMLHGIDVLDDPRINREDMEYLTELARTNPLPLWEIIDTWHRLGKIKTDHNRRRLMDICMSCAHSGVYRFNSLAHAAEMMVDFCNREINDSLARIYRSF